MEWEPNAIKGILKATSQRLAQLQAKLDADGSITRKDVATLLSQGNVALARAKALKLIHEDAQADLMEILENEIGTLAANHFQELYNKSTPTPIIIETLSSIIYAAPHIPCKELHSLSQLLAYRFGPDFAHSAQRNRDGHVSPRIVHILSAQTPTVLALNGYLVGICKTYRVEWSPDPGRCDVVDVLSEILNPGEGNEINMIALRRFCSSGIPDQPSWLRPRIWKLFLGLVPAKQDSEAREISKQRDAYYDLVRRLVEPYTSLPEPSTPTHPSDTNLLNIVHHLSRIPRELFADLGGVLEGVSPCPLSEAADDETKIPHASALDERLRVLKDQLSNTSSSESKESTPEISISDHDAPTPEEPSTPPPEPTFPRAYRFGGAHPQHCSSLLRLLFIHAAINPGQFSPHIPALLVPLYTALLLEIEPEELAHVEADTFWLFQEMVAEFSDVDEGDGSSKWMLKLDVALSQADPELHDSLRMKGLRPALPHYSYRWLAPVLTYTIPVPGLFLIWDVLFCCPRRERDSHPKLELLVELTCAMILALRKELLCLGHPKGVSALWSHEDAEVLASKNDPFLEGMSLLQGYPRTSIEDVERIIQTANDLIKQQEAARKDMSTESTSGQGQPGLGARLRHTMWKGFTNQIDNSDDSSPENSGSDRERKDKDDGNETERPAPPTTTPKSWWTTIAAPIANVTSSSEPPLPPPPQGEDAGYASSTSGVSLGLWSYAEKLRDSDTAASIAKVGTNWRARALTVGTAWTEKKPTEIGQHRRTDSHPL